MKKTYTINLSGKIFYIDDDALDTLKGYIDTLKTYYLKQEDGSEIMHDIESRVAELFTEYLKEDKREVVMINDVNKVIAVMGRPEDLIDEAEAPQAKHADSQSTINKQLPKKLFRDPQDRILGGVASGFACYFGISVRVTRVIFLLLMLFYGIFFIIYIFMWMLIPKAVTPRQRLQMEGKNINVSGIENSIREAYQNIREEQSRKNSRGARKILNIVGLTICFLILFAFLAKVIIVPIQFFAGWCMPTIDIFNPGFSSGMTTLTGMSLFAYKLISGAVMVIPIFLLFYLLAQVFFPFQSNNKRTVTYTLILWVICLMVSFSLSKTYKKKHHPGEVSIDCIYSHSSLLNSGETLYLAHDTFNINA